MMIGLIQKDLLLIKRSMGTTMLILAFLVIVFSASMGASAGMAMIPIAFSILILGTFALDDTAKWDVYVLCTPPAKRRIVLFDPDCDRGRLFCYRCSCCLTHPQRNMVPGSHPYLSSICWPGVLYECRFAATDIPFWR